MFVDVILTYPSMMKVATVSFPVKKRKEEQ